MFNQKFNPTSKEVTKASQMYLTCARLLLARSNKTKEKFLFFSHEVARAVLFGFTSILIKIELVLFLFFFDSSLFNKKLLRLVQQD